MDTAMMMMPDHRQQGRRIMTSGFDLSMSLFSNAGMGYNIPFQPSSFNYSLHPGNALSFDTYSQYEHQPSASLPPLFTTGADLPGVSCPSYPTTKPCEPFHVKVEESSPPRAFAALNSGSGTPGSDGEVTFGTEVDTLMRTIQTKAQNRVQSLSSPRSDTSSSYHGRSDGIIQGLADPCPRDTPPFGSGSKSRKTYQCDLATCGKFFYQKTHLEIHMRAHTGYKPFLCREPTCGQRFSQLGNLKTHERRHTGERPYSCEACGKRFAQRGNVRAHRTVHEQIKPFSCRLEACGKNFTQLGNLKSHQNKFHAEAIRQLTAKFAAMREGDTVSAADKELWEYFSTLYKNSNKGIKGRGKDRKISATYQEHARMKGEDSDGYLYSANSDGETASTFESIYQELGSQNDVAGESQERGPERGVSGW